MDKNKISTAYNIKLDEENNKKDRTLCKNCYNKDKRKHSNISEKLSKTDEHINIRMLLVGPNFSVKTFLMLKIHSQLFDRDIHIVTKSLPELSSNSKIKIGEIGEEMEPLNEY